VLGSDDYWLNLFEHSSKFEKLTLANVFCYTSTKRLALEIEQMLKDLVMAEKGSIETSASYGSVVYPGPSKHLVFVTKTKKCPICESSSYSSTAVHILTHHQEVNEFFDAAGEKFNSLSKILNEIKSFEAKEPSQPLEKICPFCDLSMSSNFDTHMDQFHPQELQALTNELLQIEEKMREILGFLPQISE
jgi:hypothetical protein